MSDDQRTDKALQMYASEHDEKPFLLLLEYCLQFYGTAALCHSHASYGGAAAQPRKVKAIFV